MKVEDIKLIGIGHPSGSADRQWATVQVQCSYPQGASVASAEFRLHVTRRPGITLSQIQEEAQSQVAEMAEAIGRALKAATLAEWDEIER